jgi:UDP-glucose 4-epimerase
MKIVVTGGAGFIGSHIADAYVKEGHEVVVIDNLATGFRRNINPRAKFYEADIRDREAMDRIFRTERPSAVNHHAAVAAIVESLRDPIPTFQANLLGTVNVLMALGSRGKGTRKFIFASSGAVYGTPKHIPAKESEPTSPESPYGLSKALGEDIIRFYAGQYGFAYTLFRYPNVYGPRQNPKGEAGVTAIFGGLMKASKRPTIFGDGTKSRDYTFVEDIVGANVAALHRGDGEVINLGWGETTTDQAIFDVIARGTCFHGLPHYAPARKGEAYRIALNARKAKRVLGWAPKVKLEEGIMKTIENLP